MFRNIQVQLNLSIRRRFVRLSQSSPAFNLSQAVRIKFILTSDDCSLGISLYVQLSPPFCLFTQSPISPSCEKPYDWYGEENDANKNG